MTLEEWLRYGINNGYCDTPICGYHSLPRMTVEEQMAVESGEDVCMSIVRILEQP